MEIVLNDIPINLKNIEKLYFDKKQFKKGDVIDYYIKISPFLLPHLKDRPFSMIFFPEGKIENSFYQKQCPADAPKWLKTIRLPSSRRGHIDWCLINDLQSLIYIVNKSIIEMHTWFSRADSIDMPDIAVLDLDPSGNSGIKEAVVVANAFKDILDDIGIYSVPKTSGSRGIHIFIPIKPTPYADVQKFLDFLCKIVLKQHPKLCTTERFIAKRGDRIYLDAVQCAKAKTIAMPYSMRVKSGATVSTPLKWEEVNSKLNPLDYDIVTIFDRLEKYGDLMGDFYGKQQALPLFN